MENLSNLHTDGYVKLIADIITKTLLSVSADLPKLQHTHQQPASMLPGKYCVLMEKSYWPSTPRNRLVQIEYLIGCSVIS